MEENFAKLTAKDRMVFKGKSLFGIFSSLVEAIQSVQAREIKSVLSAEGLGMINCFKEFCVGCIRYFWWHAGLKTETVTQVWAH